MSFYASGLSYVRQPHLARAHFMKTAAEYRAMADECFKWAREAQTKEVRKSYLQLAQIQTKQLKTRLRQVKASLTLVFAWGPRLLENGLGAR